ncbi:MAG: bifunctional DNA-formamidopyrimidine glycosylase/DNA-(apurinic or apyrimidinic site) lyase [Pseudonocardiaceae bacterium]|nr:bifunctional DNA-formamidopyrimidine glycosylase/DNA-(apurinic or apyrimidinic site) lyase [Pseudonocardiaceae bacterium]
MPELPEVEVVRAGLAAHVTGRTVSTVEVRHPRAIRRHIAGERDFAGRLAGRVLAAARRRGKYLWLELDGCAPAEAVLSHLGMSGQLRIQPPDAPDESHLRVRLRFADAASELRFVDQRTFGGLSVEDLVPVDGALLPRPVAHIARDPLDPLFDVEAVVTAMRVRRTGLKRALLDQTLVSGIGNIYADEALWRARLHWARPTAELRRSQARAVLTAAAEVMAEALAAGGTSFDALYVNINGRSGYFDRSLAVYGRDGLPCPRCGAAVRRDSFTNRSSYTCPRCQPRPRRPHP